MTDNQQAGQPPLDEAEATRLATEAVDSIGGPSSVYRNPRMAGSFHSTRTIDYDGYEVEIRYGEISTPAVVTIEGWVFEIWDDHLDLLIRPVRKPS